MGNQKVITVYTLNCNNSSIEWCPLQDQSLVINKQPTPSRLIDPKTNIPTEFYAPTQNSQGTIILVIE